MVVHKTLIIKTGYSEVLDSDPSSRISSLGDVLRTTPLLHNYKNDDVTWVTDITAFPLLEHNRFIKRLLPYDITTVLQIQAEEFDSVINLEKIPGICALADSIRAWKKYGFRFDRRTGKAEAYDRAFEVLALSGDPKSKKRNTKTAQDLLFEMIGAKWQGEEYVLDYKPRTEEKHDMALNTQVGAKWPVKSWSMQNWDKLEVVLQKQGFKVTRQDKQNPEVLKNLYFYMDWLNSSRIIISNDSLGLHLGIAMKKKVIGLFGPTPSSEVYFYNRGEAILPEPFYDCIPCFKPHCERGESCMRDISLERVYSKVMEWSKK